MKSLAMILFIGAASLFSSGCGARMAFTQPPDIDTEKWNRRGMSRDLVIERLGSPKSSVTNANGSREDTFEFYEGSSSGWTALRGTFHIFLDIGTLFLWEIVATPMEYALRGDKITALATFDNTYRLTSYRVLGRETKPLENRQ